MSASVITIPDITVTATPVSLLPQNNVGGHGSVHKWGVVSIQNNGAGVVYVGDSLVSATRKAAQLAAGQSWSITGSAIDPSLIFVMSTAGSTVSASGS